jgi:hypothetical protein
MQHCHRMLIEDHRDLKLYCTIKKLEIGEVVNRVTVGFINEVARPAIVEWKRRTVEPLSNHRDDEAASRL